MYLIKFSKLNTQIKTNLETLIKDNDCLVKKTIFLNKFNKIKEQF